MHVLTVTKENREELAGEVLRLVSKELDRTTDSAGAIVFRNDTVLMIRVGSRWSFPKGHLEPGETAKQAAVRETREETGISAELLTDMPIAVPSARPEDRRRVWFFPARYLEGERKPQLDEISEAAWVKVQDAAERITFAPDREAFLKACKVR